MILNDLQTKLNQLPNKSENISKALERIKLLRSYLAEIGNSDNLDLGLTSTSTLEDIVKEYNNIVLYTPLKETTVGTEGITFLPGYYKSSFTVKGTVDSSVADELAALKTAIKNATASGYSTNPADVLTGATSIRVEENEDGTLSISEVLGTAGSSENPFTAKGSEGTSEPTLTLGSGSKTLSTDIPYYLGGNKEVKIEVYETAENTVAVAELLGSGYYANPIKIIPVLELGEGADKNKAINVEANKEIIITNAGLIPLEPSTNFDFIKNGTIKVASGTSKVTAALLGNKVTLTPSTTTGWVTITEVEASENTPFKAETDGSFTITIPTITADKGVALAGSSDIDNDQKNELVVTPGAGYYDGNTAIKVTTSDGKDVEILTEGDVAIVNQENGNNAIVIPVGVAYSTITKTLDKSEINFGGDVSAELPQINISSKVTKITTSEGYTNGEEKAIVIKDASAPKLSTVPASEWTGKGEGDKVVIKIEEAGWINSGLTDITDSFVSLANVYVANNLVDNTGGVDTESAPEAGQAVFTYADNLDEVTGGIQFKIPTSGKYFASAKVDLSALITEINNI